MFCYCFKEFKPNCCVEWGRMHNLSAIPFQYTYYIFHIHAFSIYFLVSNNENFLGRNQAASAILGHVRGDKQSKHISYGKIAFQTSFLLL